MGCSINKPIEYGSFQALKCTSNDKEKNFDIYLFNKNNGYLFFYDKKKDEFIPKNERFEAGFFSENITETFSLINGNNLLITNIEYNKDLNQNYIKKLHIINLRFLTKRTIYEDNKDKYFSAKQKCIWIDPKLGIKY